MPFLRCPSGTLGGTQLFEWLRSYRPSLAKRFVVMTGELTLSAKHTLQGGRTAYSSKAFPQGRLATGVESVASVKEKCNNFKTLRACV